MKLAPGSSTIVFLSLFLSFERDRLSACKGQGWCNDQNKNMTKEEQKNWSKKQVEDVPQGSNKIEKVALQ